MVLEGPYVESDMDTVMDYIIDPVAGSPSRNRVVNGNVCTHVDGLICHWQRRLFVVFAREPKKSFQIGPLDENDVMLDRAPKSPFPGKEGFEPRSPFSGPCEGEGKWGFWTLKPSFPGNGDSGPCLGSGAAQRKLFFQKNRRTTKILKPLETVPCANCSRTEPNWSHPARVTQPVPPQKPTLGLFYFHFLEKGCGFFAYSWKLPAYSGAFYLQLDNLCSFLPTVGALLLTVLASLLTVGVFGLQWGSASNKGLKGL